MEGILCTIPGCDGRHMARGWCQKHYIRWWKYGDPFAQRHASPGSRGGIGSSGYLQVKGRNVHVQIAEQALGKPLPKKAQVHHVDYDKLNNENSNLVVCPDLAYHRLLHMRADALAACGNPNWRPCKFCKEYDDPARMYAYPGGNIFHHRACSNEYERSRLRRVGASA